MSYYAIKHIHMLAVILSGAGFLLRGVWMLAGSRLLQHKLTRILPHVIDTVLLASAIALAVIATQYPFVAGWITAKVLGLVLYIVLGTIALKRGRTRAIRMTAFVAAIVVYAWIISVAFTKSAAGFLPF